MIELLSTAEMSEADRLTIAGGVPGIDLMERAGRAVADRVAIGNSHRVLVVAGSGNNGGDGFVAARLLSERGYAARLVLTGSRDRLKGDAAIAASRWRGAVEAADPSALGECDVIIDALFGAGLDRPVEGLPRAMIEAINAAKHARQTPVLAVDLPSGVSGDSGAVMGAAVRATETVTFFRRKPGHLLMPGRDHCGQLTVADIGIPTTVLQTIRPRTFSNEPALWRGAFPVPQSSAHKYSRGHAVVVSGGMSSTGAARLAARGALRAGAGLVTIASPSDALAVNAADNLAVMVREVEGPRALAEFMADTRRNVIVLGPGGGVGPALRDKVLAALDGEAAVVLDADALTSFAGDASRLAGAIKARKRDVVLTPHDGEYARLFSDLSVKHNLHSKLEKTRAAAQFTGAFVLLKGPDTVVAAPDGRASIASNAPATLATAGSGDVLAGIIAGLLAQGMPAFEAASAGAWMHGEAANAFGPGLIAEDLPEQIPAIYRALLGAAPPLS